MMHQHYKGGVYLVVGSVHPVWNIEKMGHVELAGSANLITDDGFEPTQVYIIKDVKTNYECYVIDSSLIAGVYTLYKSLSGQLWLRQKKEFYSFLADGTPRFKPMKDIDIFNHMMALTEKLTLS